MPPEGINAFVVFGLSAAMMFVVTAILDAAFDMAIEAWVGWKTQDFVDAVAAAVLAVLLLVVSVATGFVGINLANYAFFVIGH